jgi:hypothetical protein
MDHLGKILSISAFLIAAMAVTSFGQGWGYGPVLVFDQRDGNGNVSSFGVGEYRSNRGEFGTLHNDSAQSVSVPSGFRVRFCDNEGSRGEGSGRCEEYGEGNNNLRYGGTASYVRVTGPTGWNNNGGWNSGGQRGVTVYENRDFSGRSQGYGAGRYLNMSGGLGNLRNDKASSVVVDRGFRVRLCENEGNDGRGSGRCEEYNEGRYNLRHNDSVSYVEVQRSGGWGGWNGGFPNGDRGGFPNSGVRFNDRVTVYSGGNQRGASQTFYEGVYRFTDGNFGRLPNDSASSIYVPNGYRVRLCENEGRGPVGERCEDYGAGDHTLRYQDSASSIEVRRGNSGNWELGNYNGGWNGGGRNDRGVIVYVDRDQRGASQFFDIGAYRSDQGQLGNVGNDRASSIWVGNGYRVQLCENEPRGFLGNIANTGSGRCEEYGPGRYNLRYNDTASYVRVWRQ